MDPSTGCSSNLVSAVVGVIVADEDEFALAPNLAFNSSFSCCCCLLLLGANNELLLLSAVCFLLTDDLLPAPFACCGSSTTPSSELPATGTGEADGDVCVANDCNDLLEFNVVVDCNLFADDDEAIATIVVLPVF